MPSADALKNFSRLQLGAATDTTERLVTELPKVPEDVKKRFPSMAQFEERQKEWHWKLLLALRGGAQ